MLKAPRHGRVTSTSVKVAFTRNGVKAPSGNPSRTQAADVSHQPEPEIVAESGRLREYQGHGFATGPVPSNYPYGARARA
jgi:hypothetical protein